jgi:beta-glucosidase
MNTPAFDRMNGVEAVVEVRGGEGVATLDEKVVVYYKVDKEGVINLEDVDASKGKDYTFALDLADLGEYQVELTAKSSLGELAQLPVTLFYQSVPFAAYTFNGTGGEWVTLERKVELHNKYAVLRLYFGQNGLDLKEIKFTYKRSLMETRGENR